ncbi:MAG: hypothetical protein ACQESR_24100 [Planctomycetota bacterium]
MESCLPQAVLPLVGLAANKRSSATAIPIDAIGSCFAKNSSPGCSRSTSNSTVR